MVVQHSEDIGHLDRCQVLLLSLYFRVGIKRLFLARRSIISGMGTNGLDIAVLGRRYAVFERAAFGLFL